MNRIREVFPSAVSENGVTIYFNLTEKIFGDGQRRPCYFALLVLPAPFFFFYAHCSSKDMESLLSEGKHKFPEK